MLKINKFCPSNCFGSNCYLIGLDNEYAIIDPSVGTDEVFEKIPEARGKVKYILLTHCHFDHILTINDWFNICKNVYIGAEDANGLRDPYINCYLGFLGTEDGFWGEVSELGDGDLIPLGSGTIRVIGCPGHTPGSMSYRIDNNIFVGDTVFENGGYGRCDLPLGDIDVLEKTLIRLLTHEDDANVYPGHGGKTTIKEIVTFFTE